MSTLQLHCIPEQQIQSTKFFITDDESIEDEEVLNVFLASLDPSVIVSTSQGQGQIVVLDNDSKFSLNYITVNRVVARSLDVALIFAVMKVL